MLRTINRSGYYAAITAFIAAAGYCVVQLLQVMHILVFPWDEVLIYGFSLCIATPFMIALAALHYITAVHHKPWSHIALLFGVMYAIFATLVYSVQLATVIPHRIRGDAENIAVLVLTEHSLFWTIDALAYITLGFATLFGAFAFTRERSQRWVRGFFLANALITPIISFVYFYPDFSVGLLFLGSPWMITAPGSMLTLALYFKRNRLALRQTHG